MLAAASALELAVVITSGLVAGVVTAAVGRWFELDTPRTVIGAGFIGALVALAVADLVIRGLGHWWADRPVASAVLTGLLLLAVTVLVVEGLIETLGTRRFAPAARAAVSDILDSADIGSPLAEVRERLAVARAGGEPPAPQIRAGSQYVALVDTARRARRADDHIRAALTRHAALLIATDRLNVLYDLGLEAAEAVNRLGEQITAYEARAAEEATAAGVRDYDAWRPQEPATVEGWAAVMDAETAVVTALDKLETTAGRNAGVRARDDALWRHPIARGRRPD